MTGLLVAARYLTIVPLPGVAAPPDRVALGRAAAWFPVVGLAVGAVVVAADWAGVWLFPTLLQSLVTVTVWKLVTGGLHLDGLADCFDGLGGRDAAHRLHIMDDSRIGAFGVMGLIFFLLFEIGVVAELSAGVRWRALLLAPAVARATPVLVARVFPGAKTEGHGARFHAGLSTTVVVVAAMLALVVAAALLAAEGVVAALAAGLAALAVGAFMARRLGGITGDVLGAGIEMAELVALVAVIVWTRVAP